MQKLLLYIILIMLPSVSYSVKNKSADSLKQELKKYSEDSKRLNIMLELSNILIENGDREGVVFAEQSLKLADSLKMEYEKAKALNLRGIALKIWGDNSKSTESLLKALSIFDKLDKKLDYADVLKNLGETNRAAENLDKSLIYLNRALDIFKDYNDSIGLAKTYNRLAATYYEQFYGSPNYTVMAEKIDNKGESFKTFYSNDSILRKKYDQVMYNVMLAQDYSEKKKLIRTKISSDIILAALFTSSRQYKSALTLYNSIISEINRTNSLFELPLALHSLSMYYYVKKDYKSSLEYSHKSLKIANELDIKIYKILATQKISECYKAMGNYKEAIQYLELYLAGRDEYFQKDMEFKLNSKQYDFELEKKEEEIRHNNARIIYLFIIFSGILLTVAIIVILLIRNNKRQKALNTALNQKSTIVFEQNNQLHTINSEKDKFFSIIAHDLKSPFSGFLGLTKMMSERIQDLSMRELQEVSISLKDSASNLYKLLENLLEWSRMQRGITEFNPELCMLQYIVNQNIELLTEFANHKNITLFNNIPDNTNITADVPMLNTVLRNLISNAIKFTPIGGKIEIGLLQKSSDCFIYVRDTGIGMDPETLGKLFKIDEKVSRLGTEGEPSTGLGLLLCKEFIEKHVGKIWVESEVGNGTTFYFSLSESKN